MIVPAAEDEVVMGLAYFSSSWVHRVIYENWLSEFKEKFKILLLDE